MPWVVIFTPGAERDVKTIRKKHRHLQGRLDAIVATLQRDPFDPAHSFEALKGDLAGHFSRRLSPRDRILYQVREPNVIVVSCLGHYGDH